MISCQEVDLREAEIRHAVERAWFEQLDQMLLVFCESAETCFRSLPAKGSDRVVLLRRVNELLDWVTLMIRTTQANDAAELTRLTSLSCYVHENESGSLLGCDL